MKNYILIILTLSLSSCNQQGKLNNNEEHGSIDSLELIRMIEIREEAMIHKDINITMSQFSDNIPMLLKAGEITGKSLLYSLNFL